MTRQSSITRLFSTLAALALLGADCAPAATAVPTAPPTATAVLPTLAPSATPPRPTQTPLPPTATLQPTAIPPTPTASPILLVKHPDLIVANTRDPRPTDYPQHVVYSVPGMEKVLLASELPYWHASHWDLLVDVYYPSGYQFQTKLPVVIQVHGFRGLGGNTATDKDIQQQIDWAELYAMSGMIAVSAQPGFDPLDNLNYLLDYLNRNADMLGIDMTRIGFWGVSGQGRPANLAFAKSPYRDNFRAAAFLYSDLSNVPSSWPKNLSLFVVRAGQDVNVSSSVIDTYVDAAKANHVPVTYIVLPDAVHGFDIYQDNQASRDAVQQTLKFMQARLGATP